MGKPALDLSQLSAQDKAELIDELWASFCSDDLELPDALRAELNRRLERLAANPSSVVPWESVQAQMRSRSGSRG